MLNNTIEIYTTYFANVRNLPSDVTPNGIEVKEYEVNK